MNYEYHTIIIGAGSGGLVVASGCAAFGTKTALIESNKMGGDCLNTGCVPSKTFLRTAHIADFIRHANEFALKADLKKVDISQVMKRVDHVIKKIEPHDSKKRYESMGVKVFLGKASLLDNHTVKAGNKKITAKNIVIATGSEPVIPPVPGLNKIPFLTNKNIFKIKTLPKHMIILGGGPIGLELGQGFRHLGSEVTVIDRNTGIFKKDDPEVGPLMEKKFKSEGINLLFDSTITQVKKIKNDIIALIKKDGREYKIKGSHLLVASGRKPAVEGLGLDNIGIKTDQHSYIITNRKMQTNIKNIYACGDVTGPFQFTHMAGYQAGIVVRNIIFPFKAKVDYSSVVWTTYTKPEVAHVGYTEPLAKKMRLFNDSVIINLNEIDRALAEKDDTGFLKLNLDKKNRIIGATMVGEKAGEMIHLATMAVKKRLKVSVFAGLIFSYPTEAEIFRSASFEILKKSFKPWMKKIIKSLFIK